MSPMVPVILPLRASKVGISVNLRPRNGNFTAHYLNTEIGNGRSAMATSGASDQGIYCYVMTSIREKWRRRSRCA